MRWHREAYLDHLLNEGCGREILVEMFGPLVGLEAEWRAQGASPDECSLDAFDFDRVDVVRVGRTQPIGDHPEGVELEDETQRITVDHMGRRMRLVKATASIPLPMDYPVRSMDDWLKVRHWMSDSPARVTDEEIEAASQRRAGGGLVAVGMPGGYDLPRKLMGEENACLAFIDQPELIVDMLAAAAETVVSVIRRIAQRCPIDYLCVHEDFAGKSGPLIGPVMFDEFVRPYYQRVWSAVQEAGGRVFSIDSDGNMNAIIDALMAAGINQCYPLEPAAGMDMVALRKRYGRTLILKGGIDKHVLRKSKADIRRELEYKLQPCMHGGGVVFGIDHRIPNGTPIENYRYYVQTARELLGLPPATPTPGSWTRMAF